MERTNDVLTRRIQRSLERRGLVSNVSAKPIFAYVNHGRWVADCPCGGAELVTEGRRMTCGSCGLISPVTYPPEVAEIERVLHGRPMPATMNWYPGETVEQLEAENMEYR